MLSGKERFVHSHLGLSFATSFEKQVVWKSGYTYEYHSDGTMSSAFSFGRLCAGQQNFRFL